MPTRAQRRRSPTAELIFQGQAVSPDLLPSLWRKGQEQRWFSRYRQSVARGIRLKTMVIALNETWVERHPEAAEWVVKVLPERRTLERDLIASVADVEPTYTRAAIGQERNQDFDDAAACENYMEEWRKAYVPFQTFAQKAAEDGEFGVVAIPTPMDREGCPDFYDRLSERAYTALSEEKQAEYAPATVRHPDTGEERPHPRGGYVKRGEDGSVKRNPRYDGMSDEQADEAHAEAVRRYLLKQEQGGVTVRVIPSAECVPFLARGTKKERWRTVAILERTLYFPEELRAEGYGWRGMGDRMLIPQGFDATRASGQNGMFYLYTLYWVWTDPDDPLKIRRPLIAYSVAGNPTWTEEPSDAQRLPDNGVAILDLYEEYGLEGAFWWYGGGLHTSDDSADFYWEPYLWPLSETILTIEGKQTSINAAVATGSFTGWFHRPDPKLIEQDADALVDSATQQLVHPEMPASGDIKTVVGEVFPATPTQVSPDAWRAVEMDLASLRENTALERPGGVGDQPSGHAMVVAETIGQTARRHIRECGRDASRFCGESAMRIFTAAEREYNTPWPIQTTKERPVGSEMQTVTSVLEWNSRWIGEGEYQLGCEYPEEYNPVKVQTLMTGVQLGLNSPEEVWAAQGITDPETQWAKVLKWRIRQTPTYIEAQTTRLAKRQGDTLMLQVLKLQQQQKMTQSGPPGFETGLPTSMVSGPSSGGGGMLGGPTSAQSSLGGQMAAETGPALQDARAAAMVAPLRQGAA